VYKLFFNFKPGWHTDTRINKSIICKRKVVPGGQANELYIWACI